MSNEMNGVEAPLASKRKASKRSSIAVKLVQAAALAAVLVPLGSVSVETTSCGFGGYYGNNGSGACTGSAPNHQQYHFSDNISFDLTLQNVFGSFLINITSDPMTQGGFDARTATAFSDYLCVDLVDPTSTGAANGACRDFPVGVGSGGGFSGYTFLIKWLYNSETLFPDNGGHITVVHDEGSVSGNQYSQDMCQTFHNCSYSSLNDPSISSGDTDFASVAVALNPNATAVPEPTTLILLGSGLGGMLYRRRRRKPRPA